MLSVDVKESGVKHSSCSLINTKMHKYKEQNVNVRQRPERAKSTGSFFLIKCSSGDRAA